MRAADRNGRRNRIQFTFADFKVPAYVLGIVAVGIVLYFAFGRTLFKPAIQRRHFNACLERLRDVNIAMKKNLTDHPGYTIGGLYNHMNKGTNMDVEAWVDQTCVSAGDRGQWTLIKDITVTGKTYQIRGAADFDPLCPIIITPVSYWPQDYSQCGTRPPPGVLDE